MTNPASQNNSPRGSGLRLGLGLPFAAVVTAGLFLAMGAMIKSEDLKITPQQDPPTLSYLREKPEQPVEPEIEKPVIPTDTPPEPKTDWKQEIGDTGPKISIDRPDPVAPEYGTSEIPTMRGAILQYEPLYPDRCASRNIEGNVTVEFDVTALGAVVNERVVSSANSCLNSAALEAIRKWKFAPAGSGGNAIVERGVRKTFSFKLQG